MGKDIPPVGRPCTSPGDRQDVRGPWAAPLGRAVTPLWPGDRASPSCVSRSGLHALPGAFPLPPFSFFPFYCCCSNSKNNTFFHCNVFQSESNPSSPLRASHPRSNHCQLFGVYHFRYFPCLHTHVGYAHVNMILGKLDLPARMHIIL